MEQFEEITGYLMSLDMSAGNTLLKNVSAFIDKEKMVGVEIDKKKKTADGFMIIAGGERDYGNLSDEVIGIVGACKKIIAGDAQEQESEAVEIIDENGTDVLKNEPYTIDREIPAQKPLQKEPQKSAAPTNTEFFDYIRRITGNDVFEIFADSGRCKTKVCLEAIRQALSKGLRVWYIDAEHNLSDEEIKALKGLKYTYEPRLQKIFDMTEPSKLPKDIDVIVLDSIGYPGLAAWARLKANDRGNALLHVIAIFDGLKQWALMTGGFALVTNQPESKFAKPKDYIRDPWGDKGAFATKEIFQLEYSGRSPNSTSVSMKAHRSRRMGRGREIAKIIVSDAGTKITMVEK